MLYSIDTFQQIQLIVFVIEKVEHEYTVSECDGPLSEIF